MTRAGIELATLRFVAHNLNHCATAVPWRFVWKAGKFLADDTVYRTTEIIGNDKIKYCWLQGCETVSSCRFTPTIKKIAPTWSRQVVYSSTLITEATSPHWYTPVKTQGFAHPRQLHSKHRRETLDPQHSEQRRKHRLLLTDRQTLGRPRWAQ